MNISILRIYRLPIFLSFILSVLPFSVSNAGPIVTEWDFSTNATFSDAVFSGTSGTTIATDSELSWGHAGADFQNSTNHFTVARSALTIGSGSEDPHRVGGGPVTGSVSTVLGGLDDVTLDKIGLGVSFTHWNNPISSWFSTLLRAMVNDTLTLTPQGSGTSIDAPDLAFDFEFRETPNAGPCAGGTVAPCGDLFGFTGTPNLNIGFAYDDVDYFAHIFILGQDLNPSISPIAFLNDGQCAALGFLDGPSGQRCQGFITTEAAWTTVQFGFAVSTEAFAVAAASVPVDEPESLSLLLLAFVMVALPFYRHHRANKVKV
ncbi:THxN family PEP-CTERM protein [Vibrio sp. Of7-15]|uniref:THxN family PEP-CTERM protein n=1 Tax=Vibrio sp. Of7-15 TaxID=2724879 RepID=UPI001EF2DD92|nr:THxN family PEP-CTERM protein [Vibrio sp. Of7-15]MCG7497214.1 THxN family PEP-CTERM protein [Vibrio sp. Of7-15]